MEHHHDHDCTCGHDTCGCGHHHHHHHDDGKPAFQPSSITCKNELTENEVIFLHQLSQYHYLPVAQFIVRSSKQDDFEIVALQPVFIRSIRDTMEEVKESGAFLQKLYDMGMISLDYDIPLDGYAYHDYKESDLYKDFCDSVGEAVEKADETFLGDTPAIELGSMGLTEASQALFAE